MSQVIQNHVLRVGQTVCVSSREESKSLHPGGYPGCSALPMKYVCCSREGWAAPAAMGHANARLLPGGALYGAHPTFEHVSAQAQGKGQEDTSLEKPTAPYRPKVEEKETGTDPEAHLVSPTLDISIETLNQMILEIDPTFQPLTCEPVKDAVQPASQGDAVATKKQDPEAIGEAKGAVARWSQRSSELVKPTRERQSESPGQRARPHASPSGQDEVLCSCGGLGPGTGDGPHHPQRDRHFVWGTVS